MKEYTTMDKSGWGGGDWQNEFDKAQWVDETTGLDCLIVRNGGGALCGYVGVSEGHPFFGKEYDACRVPCECPNREEEYHYCDGSYLSVHGGLTYSDFCQEGDDKSHGICHVPEEGRPERVWWLGFDCAHSGDVSPKYDNDLIGLGLQGAGYDTYKNAAYVKCECTQLAAQLAALVTA